MLDSVESGSLVPVAAPAASVSAPAASPVRGLAALRSAPLSLSVLAHVGLAFAAAAHVRAPQVPALREASVIEVAATDLAVDVEPVSAPPVEHAVEPPSAPVAQRLTRVASAPPSVAATQPASSPLVGAAGDGAVVTPAPAAAPRFALTVAVGSPPSSALASAPAATSDGRENGANGVAAASEAPLSEHTVDSPAKLLVGAPPAYTAAAQAAGVEADVPLEIVVDRGGAVQSARPLAHIGYGLDEAALSAVRGYRFSAAHRAGNAVAVRMRWLMRFQLR